VDGNRGAGGGDARGDPPLSGERCARSKTAARSWWQTTCHELRREHGPGLPILFLSGERTEPYDRVAGLLLGADD
jgi:hypothetical protein